MKFRSISDLSRTIHSNIGKIPSDIEIVVGVPRSGLLAANIIALAMNRPLASLDEFLEGRILHSGHRKSFAVKCENPGEARVLLVEDALSTGTALREVREKISGVLKPENVTILCVYGADDAPDLCDVVLETFERPMMFEWNFLHHPHLRHCCVDIDGVLCRDAQWTEDDDGPKYREFLAEAEPLMVPSKRVGWLVTSRLEKYRSQTEDWLRRHEVDYGELIMLDLPDVATRRRLSASAPFKGEVFKGLTSSKLFIESSLKEARRIARISGKPCLSIEELRFFEPDPLTAGALKQRLRQLVKSRVGRLRKMLEGSAG